ncbi:hypothetical protein ACFL2T_02675 [Elusimicrobiota bacterium]
MDIILGFILGVIASVFASFIVSSLPTHRYRPLIAFGKNPGLFIRLLVGGEEQIIYNRISVLFRAWETKNEKAYLECWTEDAVRIVGAKSNSKQNKDKIGKVFRASCKRYLKIKVPCAILEQVSLNPSKNKAIAHVYYRMDLVRSKDNLPVYEESREVYALKKSERKWLITSNIDHFCEIRPTTLEQIS